MRMKPAFATAPVSGTASAAQASSATWSSRKWSIAAMLRDGECVQRAAQRADETRELGRSLLSRFDRAGADGDPVDELCRGARVLGRRDAEAGVEGDVG